ncbi:MAG: FAD:protein FMN transferase [Bacteroidia bacterium]|nr:MAG: FAD:protein FMN transferase [Bacteroidia bacterium]
MRISVKYNWVPIMIILMAACNTENGSGIYNSIQGFTQGTTYNITYQHPTEDELQGQIDSLLKLFDSSLSTYEPTSIISGINQNLPDVHTDSMFRTVFRESARVYQLTGGAFDITLGPVINAWGFGAGERLEVDSAMVDSLLQYVGMGKVFLKGDRVLKSDPHVLLNVNAIAQGYAVDVVSFYLEKLGCRNYMVEIGGEIRTRGMNSRGNFWRIGVDRPEFGNMIPGEQLQVIINMHNRSLATSGNYRKFYEKDGVRITHTIDPATGYPKESKLLSVTILSDECMTADAYATACMAMGFEKAQSFVENQKGVDAYFIYGDELAAYKVWYSEGLKKYIDSP